MIRITTTGILCLLIAGAVSAKQSVQATFTVSPSGNDANPGTSAQPFLTLERARQAVRAINGAMAGDIVVTVRGGTYTLPSTLTFDAADSGTNGFRVIYRAAAGEKPVISGGQRITGWSAIGGGVYRAPVGSLRFRQLYVNGVRAIRARKPNTGSYHQHRGYDEANRRIIVAASEISAWQRLNQVELVILTGNVAQRNLRVASFALSGTSAYVTPMQPERDRAWAWPYPPRFSGQYYYYENAYEFLDAPGEFYLNPTTSEVFYRPRTGEDLATAVVVAPRLENVMRVQGTLPAPVHHLRFEGLTFEHSTWLNPNAEGFVGDQAYIEFTQPLPNDQLASYPGNRIPAAVHVEAANNVRFERNLFRRTGAGAVIFRAGVSDTQFVGNVIEETGGYGIGVDQNLEGNPADLRKVCRRVQIRNNYLHGIGRDNLGNAAIVCAYTDGAVIEHNEIHDVSYVGISVGWGWTDRDNVSGNNLVRYNHIYETDTMYGDAGGIYTLSRQRGTVVAENYVHDVVYYPWTAYGYSSAGVFLDEGSNFITVRDNVLLNVPGKIKLNAVGSSNVFANNDGSSATVIANAGLEAAYRDIKAPPPPTLPIVTVTASDASAAEPSNPGTFTVTRTGATTSSLAVRVAVAGTASAADYGPLGTTVTIPAGSASTTKTVTPVDDAIVEPSETVVLTIAADAAYTVGSPSSATVTIADNDGSLLPVVSVTASDASAGEPSNPGIFTISRTGATTAALTVRFTSAGTAGAADYASLGTTVMIPAGSASATKTVTPVDDSTVEPSETVVLTIAADAAYTVGSPSSAAVTIADNDTAPPPPPGTGLRLAYSFNETSGTTAADASGNGHPGTLVNGAVFAPGRHGNAVNIDGTNDYVIVNNPNLPTGDFTMEAWVNLNNLGRFRAILVCLNGELEFDLDEVGAVWVWTNGAERIRTAATVPVGTWTHVALTRQGSTLRVFMNGSPVGSGTDGGVLAFNGAPLLIGVDTDDGATGMLNGFFDGRIDEVRVYGRALTATEIQSDMATPIGTGATALFTLADSDLDGVPDLEESRQGTDPLNEKSFFDNDRDGTPDVVDLDIDNDGILNVDDPDRDGDGATNHEEALAGTNPDDRTSFPNDLRDNDGDGIPNADDLDDDNDGIPDLEDGDADGDGIGNGEEIQAGSDPSDKASAPAAAGLVTEGSGGGGCGATGIETLPALGVLAFFRRWRRKKSNLLLP